MDYGPWPSTHPSLLDKASLGAPNAWRDLFANYGVVIVQYAMARGLSESDAEDVAQEVFQILFLELSNRRFQYDSGKGRFRGWLAKVIRQRAWRLKEKRKSDSACRFDTVTLAQTVAGKADAVGLDERVKDAVDRLRVSMTESEWRVFDLYWNQHLKPRQIAKLTGFTSSQISKLIFQCRKRIMELCKSDPYSSG